MLSLGQHRKQGAEVAGGTEERGKENLTQASWLMDLCDLHCLWETGINRTRSLYVWGV